MTIRSVFLTLLLAGLTALVHAEGVRSGRPMQFVATAYALDGPTASGDLARPGIVAADTDVLPLGTKIRITQAGPHSGVYVVSDTGRKVQGRQVDIYMPDAASAKEFGRKEVRVIVLKWGERQ
jgi:3D (Asp-Asp-Asp) domain-containing protein